MKKKLFQLVLVQLVSTSFSKKLAEYWLNMGIHRGLIFETCHRHLHSFKIEDVVIKIFIYSSGKR